MFFSYFSPLSIELQYRASFFAMFRSLYANKKIALSRLVFTQMGQTYCMYLFTVFVHAKEDSIWLHLSMPPIRMTSIHMDILQRPDICGIEGVVTEKRIISLNKPHNPCLDYPDGQNEFVQCIKNYFIEYIKVKISCTLPGCYESLYLTYEL